MPCFVTTAVMKSKNFIIEVCLSLQRTTNGFRARLIKPNTYQNELLAITCTSKNQIKPLDQQTPIDRILHDLINDLQEEQKEEEHVIDKKFHTVDEFDALVSQKQQESSTSDRSSNRTNVDCSREDEKGARSKALERELSSLEVESFKFFSTVPSLKEWNGGEHEISDSSSHDTPKIGNVEKDGDDDQCSYLDADFIEALEEALNKLTAEEEDIIREMLDVA